MLVSIFTVAIDTLKRRHGEAAACITRLKHEQRQVAHRLKSVTVHHLDCVTGNMTNLFYTH
jgi:hypothetical protein